MLCALLTAISANLTMVAGPCGAVDERVGVETISYVNPEFTADGRYMVWLEPFGGPLANGDRLGYMWHCGVDTATGALIPEDGKGYRGFLTTFYKRGNPGMDADGPYYVGARPDGSLVEVRIDGPQQGSLRSISTNPPNDPERRGIFPSSLQDSSERYVFWFKGHPGPSPGDAEWVEIQLTDIDETEQTFVVERQYRPAIGWTPMDLSVPRWATGSRIFTYGYTDQVTGNLQVRKATVAAGPQVDLLDLAVAQTDLIDPHPEMRDGRLYLFPGIEGSSESRAYGESAGQSGFSLVDVFAPQGSLLEIPCRAQSHEPFVFQERLYTAYQLSDCVDNGSFFIAPGEIWLSLVGESATMTWRLSNDAEVVRNEPEAVAGADHAWVFYTAYPLGANPLEAHYELWRAPVPHAVPPSHMPWLRVPWFARTLESKP